MSPHIFDYVERKDKTHSSLYLGAVGIAMVAAYSLIFGFKLLIYMGKLIIENWVWAIGIVIGFFILKKIMINKKRRPRNDYPPREV